MRCIASTVRPVPVTVTSMPPSIGFVTASALSVTSLMSMRCWRNASRLTLDQSVLGSASKCEQSLG